MLRTVTTSYVNERHPAILFKRLSTHIPHIGLPTSLAGLRPVVGLPILTLVTSMTHPKPYALMLSPSGSYSVILEHFLALQSDRPEDHKVVSMQNGLGVPTLQPDHVGIPSIPYLPSDMVFRYSVLVLYKYFCILASSLVRISTKITPLVFRVISASCYDCVATRFGH